MTGSLKFSKYLYLLESLLMKTWECLMKEFGMNNVTPDEHIDSLCWNLGEVLPSFVSHSVPSFFVVVFLLLDPFNRFGGYLESIPAAYGLRQGSARNELPAHLGAGVSIWRFRTLHKGTSAVL